MDYSEIIKRLEDQFGFKGNKAAKEHHVIENFLLEISNEKLVWYKPWKYFSLLNKVKKAVALIGSIASSCLIEQIDMNKTQLDLIEVQKMFQKEIDDLKQKIDKL